MRRCPLPQQSGGGRRDDGVVGRCGHGLFRPKMGDPASAAANRRRGSTDGTPVHPRQQRRYLHRSSPPITDYDMAGRLVAGIGVNLTGVANAMWCAARHMLQFADGGRIVNISSRGRFAANRLHRAYGASKAGLNAMSQSLGQTAGTAQHFCRRGRARLCRNRYGGRSSGRCCRRRHSRAKPV